MLLCSKNNRDFVIMGVSLDTGNLGVSALLASTVQRIRHVFPDARICLLDGVRKPVPQIVNMADGQSVQLERVGIRCNMTVWRQNHLLRLLGSAMFARVLPVNWRRRWLRRNPYLNAIVSARVVMDISGGDSFSDIYGMKRLVLGSLRKILVVLCGGELVLLPQTYGPFRSALARCLARLILPRASAVYSRDREGLEEVNKLVDRHRMKGVPRFCPDVAFVLDTIRPETGQTDKIERLKAEGWQVIGLNVSGLLYNGGYTGRNEFGLRCDYRLLVRDILRTFARQEDCRVLLIPHVITEDFAVANDLAACEKLWQGLSPAEQEKVMVLDGRYDQSEVKYLIGLCDFFMGARMHSTIAALSQCVPAVGMAYSKKFAGVFETAGVEEYVVDMREIEEVQILSRIQELYETRKLARWQLMDVIPRVREQVISLFNSMKST